MTHRGQPVDLDGDPPTALMTVEGEKDDISGVGQTEAAHDLCVNIPETKKPIICSRTSATTASSTARASAPRSRRAFATSWATIDGKPAKHVPPAKVIKSKTGKPLVSNGAKAPRLVPVPA